MWVLSSSSQRRVAYFQFSSFKRNSICCGNFSCATMKKSIFMIMINCSFFSPFLMFDECVPSARCNDLCSFSSRAAALYVMHARNFFQQLVFFNVANVLVSGFYLLWIWNFSQWYVDNSSGSKKRNIAMKSDSNFWPYFGALNCIHEPFYYT